MERDALVRLLFDLATDSGHSVQEAEEIVKDAIELGKENLNSLSGPELKGYLKRSLTNIARAAGHSRDEAERIAERRVAHIRFG